MRSPWSVRVLLLLCVPLVSACGAAGELRPESGCVECTVSACIGTDKTRIERVQLSLMLGRGTGMLETARLKLTHPQHPTLRPIPLDPTGWRLGPRFTPEEIAHDWFRMIPRVNDWERVKASLEVRRLVDGRASDEVWSLPVYVSDCR